MAYTPIGTLAQRGQPSYGYTYQLEGYRSMAEAATRDRSAGQLCEQRYDALIQPEAAPQ